MSANATRSPAVKELSTLVRRGEGPTLEFKRSTGELREGMQTICAFLNGSGGTVYFGVRPDGRVIGQQVSDQTLRDVAEAIHRIEPSAHVAIRRCPAEPGHEVLALSVAGGKGSRPYLFDGRPFERVASTTRRMPREKHEALIVQRVHATHRWENAPAEGLEVKDLDRDEIFRIVEAARSTGRIVGPIGRRVPEILDRLNVRKEGRVLQAAVVLFGKKFLPDYPQCELRMARFRGVDNAEFLDQRQIHGPAFKLLEEAELFCQRHFPLPGKIVPGKLQRVDTPLIPPDAMREILVNALIHRDYGIAGGAVALAIFDDRVEVWSPGGFPPGITPEMLTRRHSSVQRNPFIADAFFRAGLIERWGRGTNRVAAMCRTAGISAPIFEEIGPAAVVTFPVRVGSTGKELAPSSPESKVQDRPKTAAQDRPKMAAQDRPKTAAQDQPKTAAQDGGASRRPKTGRIRKHGSSSVVPVVSVVKVAPLDMRILAALAEGDRSAREIRSALDYRTRSGAIKTAIAKLLSAAWIKHTIARKATSRYQKYRLTVAGERVLRDREASDR